MSRIGSMAKKAQQTVSHAQQKVREVKQQVDARKPASPTQSDSFQGTKRREASRTLGFEARSATGHEEALVGAKARGFTQRTATTLSTGGDVFVGARASQRADGTRSSMKLGAELRGAVTVGARLGAEGAAQLGLEAREERRTHTDLGAGRELQQRTSVAVLAGAVASAGAHVGTMSGAKADLFVGVRAGGEERLSVSEGTTERLGVGGRLAGMAGVGVQVDVEGGYDVDRRQVKMSAGAGAALGLGAYVGGELTLGGPKEE